MPALAAQVMGGGFSYGQVQAMNGTLSNIIAAAGTTRTAATVLTNALVNVATATSLQGVSLPTIAIPGDELVIFNSSGNTIVIYPQSSTAKINGLATGSGFQLANNTSCQCNMITTTQWSAIVSA
jgi:hypothetical protein